MNSSQRKRKSNVGVCYYHLCRKRTKVYKCRHCGEFFCHEHLKAKPPGLPRFDGTSQKDRLFMEEWQKPGGHPCIPFLSLWEAENKRKKQEYDQALNRIIESKNTYFDNGEKYDPTHEEPIEKSKYVEKQKNLILKNKTNHSKYAIGILLIFIFYLLFNFGGAFFGNTFNCTDGTIYNHCSIDKPYYCSNGTLIQNSNLCGCPNDYRIKDNYCELIPRCEDRTIYGECSANRPLYCSNGSLIQNASFCGCPLNEVLKGDECVSKYETKPKEQKFSYVVKGKIDSIKLIVYGGLNDYLAGISRYYYCNPICPSDRDLELRFLDQTEQAKYIKTLVEIIKSKSNNSDEQARIAIGLVQKIPYDWEGFTANNLNNRYPYEVLYNKLGVCAEKARLLAFILRELGFGVVLFDYKVENHMAVGIKCPSQYSYRDSGYCFVEAASTSIITDSEGDYVGVGKLSSIPNTISISEGKAFDSVSEEYNDAKEWNLINELSKSSDYLDSSTYYRWQWLVNKYGIEVTENNF